MIFGFFKLMNPFEVVVRIFISQLLRGSTPRADNAEACFDGKFWSHVFGGHFLLFWGILGVLVLNFAFFTPPPQKGTSLSEKTSFGVFHETF